MLPIFKHEEKDGLSDQIQAKSSIILASQAQPVKKDSKNLASFFSSNAEVDINQFDLFYLESILASVGWNGNDDVFEKAEVWKARKTPVDKQFNYMHDESDIIGHLVSSNVIDFNGDIIEEESSLPDEFDVVVGSVLYKHWSDAKLQERMDQIIADIKDGKWFVSMECLFRNFDYAVITADNEHKILARNDETSFLTKHLRVYGGDGYYDDCKIGRLIRNFTFSGKGLVDNPANPRSCITKSNKSTFVGIQATADELEISQKEYNFMTVTQEQYDSLQSKYDALANELKELKASKDEAVQKEIDQLKSQITELEGKNTQLQNDLDASKEIAEAKNSNVEDLQNQLKEAQEKLTEAENKLKEQEAEAIKATRKNLLLAKVDEEKADALVEKFANASSEMFDSLLEALPAKKDEEYDDKEEDDKKKKESKSDVNVDTDNNVDTDIDDAKAGQNADMSSGGDDTTVNLSAKAANWLTSNVLHSTAGKNKEGE